MNFTPKENPLILGIESSCDETAAAVIRGRELLSDEIASSAATQAKFGGVVPEIASRAHAEAVDEVVARALAAAGVGKEELDAVAVTYGAGLLGALLVGESYAKALAYALDKPLYAVNHIRGHIAVNYIASPVLEPPFVCLIASGGHTAIALAKGYDEMELLGTTQDDACGEAFDKVARVLGLPYPGGPRIQELAAGGKPVIPLPHPFKGSDTLDFSFSGIKTAVINYANSVKMKGEELPAADLACSFQELVTDIMADNLVRAARMYNCNKVVIAGGVGANIRLREKVEERAKERGLTAFYPPVKLCTDNGVMIAAQTLCMIKAGRQPSDFDLDADANLPVSG